MPRPTRPHRKAELRRNLHRCALGTLLAAALCLWACSDHTSSEPDTSCPPGRVFDETIGHCVALAPDLSSDTDAAPIDTTATDSQAPPDTGIVDTSDPALDTGIVDTIDPTCDKDHDGALEIACGGDDCNDESAAVAPGLGELCDRVDNNCDGLNNEGVDCGFYAHTATDLYRVDPFALTTTRTTSVPDLFDIDTHPDGSLYGITSEGLYFFDRNASSWILRGTYPAIVGANGLAIDSAGSAFVTAAGQVWTVNLSNAQPTLVGSLGGSLQSSGDCVFNKADNLLMTSPSSGSNDQLVLIDRATGRGTVIGDIGFPDVYGMTAAWGTLYGLTGYGDLIAIDRQTGAGTLVHRFPSQAWYGAASTPAR